MEKYFHSLFIIFISACCMSAQKINVLNLDTLIQADEIYLDPINQIYLIDYSDKSITKYNLNFLVLKRISFNQGWDQAAMDVSDPFKCILYYPGGYKILVLDESLAVISSYDESGLNAQSTVCHFTTDYFGLYSNNVLKLINYDQQKTISSEPLFNPDSYVPEFPNQLKKSNEYLYLLRPGIGISRFTNQLFEDNKWLNDKARKMDVSGDQLFYCTENEIIKFDTQLKSEETIWKEPVAIKSFAVNSEYIAVLENKHLKLMKWK